MVFFSPRDSRHARTAHARFRPAVHALEGRDLPSTLLASISLGNPPNGASPIVRSLDAGVSLTVMDAHTQTVTPGESGGGAANHPPDPAASPGSENSLPPTDVANVLFTGASPSIGITLEFSSSAVSRNVNDRVTINWGDGQTSSLTAAPGTVKSVSANHVYAMPGPFSIQVTLEQTNALLVGMSLVLHIPSPVLADAAAVPGAAVFLGLTIPGGSPGGSPIGAVQPWAGGIPEATGYVSWKSITDHGTPAVPGAPASAITVFYMPPAQESLSSLRSTSSVGLFVSVIFQISSGAGQDTNTTAPAQAFAPPVNARTVVSVEARPEPVASGARANAYGNGTKAVNAISSPVDEPAGIQSDRASTIIAASISSDSEVGGQALWGEPLLGQVPNQRDVIAIAEEILAGERHRPRDETSAENWLQRTLLGAVLGVLVAQPIIWGIPSIRRRPAERLGPALR